MQDACGYVRVKVVRVGEAVVADMEFSMRLEGHTETFRRAGLIVDVQGMC